jgi:SAM-dependent methyltransferase
MWFFVFLSALATIAIVSILWPGLRGAPWVPTRLRTVRKMLELAEVRPDDLVYDLGCGDGRTIVTAAWRYGARAVGIEIDPLRLLDSTNRKLQKKLLSELEPGTRVVSHMFAFPELHLVHYDNQVQLYLYDPKKQHP